jgi:hypothetical protein
MSSGDIIATSISAHAAAMVEGGFSASKIANDAGALAVPFSVQRKFAFRWDPDSPAASTVHATALAARTG